MILSIQLFLFVILTTAVTGIGAATDWLPGANYWGVAIDPVTYKHGGQLFKPTGDCVTQDGKYKIMCGLNMISLYETDTDLSTNVYAKTTTYSSDGTSQIDGQAGGSFLGFKAKGSYSDSHETINKVSSEEDKTYVESSIAMRLYKIFTDSLTIPYSDELLKYINLASSALTDNDHERYMYWITQLAIDYPSTYVSEILVGGMLMQKQFVDDSYCQVTNEDIVKHAASASASFAGFGASAKYNYGLTTEQVDAYKSHVSYTTTATVGGVYLVNGTLAEWQQSVPTNPAVLKYTVSDTKDLLQPELFPGYPAEHITQIRTDYIGIYQQYLTNNSHPGCPARNATNYKVWANEDTGNCTFVDGSGSPFGGFFFRSTHSSGLPSVGNPINNNEVSCPIGFFESCHDGGQEEIVTCICLAGEITARNGPSFGGGYGWTVNAITNSSTCPSGFIPQVVFSTGVCIGPQNQPGYVMGGQYITDGQDGNVNNGCLIKNPYTGHCTCPSEAPWSFMVNTADPNVWTSRLYHQIVVCYGGPMFLPPADPGQPIPYQPLLAAPSSSSPPSPVQKSFDEKQFVIIFSSIATTMVICCIIGSAVFVLYRLKREHVRNEYAQIN